ncbi:unnamed protein product, partial [marine sediment metagenome]
MKREKIIIFGLVILTVLLTGCLGKEYPKKTKEDEKAVKIEERDTEYRYFFAEGIKQKMLGNLGQAARYFEKTMALNKKSSAACYELSSIYTITRNYNEAIKYARKAEKLDEKNIWYKLHLANLYHITQNIDSTIV